MNQLLKTTLKLFLVFGVFCVYSNANAQNLTKKNQIFDYSLQEFLLKVEDNSLIDHQNRSDECHTTEVNMPFAEGAKGYSRKLPSANPNQKKMMTWTYTDGYCGSGAACAPCDHNCDVAPYVNAPQSGSCNDGNYMVPVVFTVFTDDDGTNLAITDAVADNGVTVLNDFFDCLSIPIQFYESQEPRVIADSDLNNFKRSEAASGVDDGVNGCNRLIKSRYECRCHWSNRYRSWH